ncbi:MAG: hypothetical protein ACW98Y_13050 [Candidatus Thorarchaeota archaeon]|jgi:hypothetical protein
MKDAKERLVHLVNKEDLSAIQLLAGEVGVSEEETRELLEETLREGLVDGYITEDGKRIFKNQIELSDKPTIKSEEQPPEFLSYNTTPGKVVAIIGFLIVIVGAIVLTANSGIIYYENLGLLLLLAGSLITMFGGYWVGRLKTP